MGLQFEGVLEDINEEVQKACKNILADRGITEGKVNVEVVGKKGDNYVAVVRRFIVENGDSEKPFQMVVKIAPTQELSRTMMNAGAIFRNESIIYTKVLPKYEELQKIAGVPFEDRIKSAICYGSNLEAPNECIALEDLKLSGYTILNRFVSLTDEQVRLILKDLAKYHSLAFVLRHQDKGTFEEIKNELYDGWRDFDKNEEIQAYFELLSSDLDSVLDIEEHKKRVEGLLTSFAKNALNISIADFNSRYSVILQGDCWTNNVMFKLEDGKPVSTIMLDYQISRIASPVGDILYFIFNCTDAETRKGRYHDWLDYYYENIEDFLTYFNLKANYVYPRDEFDADLQRHGKTSLPMAVMLANILVRDGEDVVDFRDQTSEDMAENMKNMGMGGMKDSSREKFKNKIRGVVNDFIDYGYI